jgi:hypothetical protein
MGAGKGAAGAMLLVLLGGTGLVLLSLHLLVLLAVPPGPAAAALRASLDPARPGSLPDLWALAQLALAGIALPLLHARAGRRSWLPAGLVPVALLLADAGNLTARLAPAAAADRGSVLLGKLTAGILAGGLALVPALLTWRDSCPERRGTGKRLVGLLLLFGALSLALDLLGGWARTLGGTEPVLHLLATVEEGAELILYALVASLLLGQALDDARGRAIGPVPVRLG